MSNGFRRAAVFALLIIGIAFGMNGILQKPNCNCLTGHAKLLCEKIQVDSISICSDGTVSVNTEDADDLTELPGIGETIASAWLLEYQENGPFFYAEDLLSIRGIGEKKLKQLMPLINLSTEKR